MRMLPPPQETEIAISWAEAAAAQALTEEGSLRASERPAQQTAQDD